MNALRVFVADDEPLAMRRVLRSVDRLPDLEIVGMAADGEEAREAIEVLKPDLLILDIMMPGLSGFDLLAALSDEWAPAVIFVTAFDRFAVDAFAEGAIDYILKPLDDERLALAVDRARTRLGEEKTKQRFEQLRTTLARMNTDFNSAITSPYESDLWVRDGGAVTRVRVRDIDWIEATGDYVTLHAKGMTHLADDSIRSLVERLDPAHFLQVHRSHIVRLDAVASIEREKFSGIGLRMSSGEKVRVSKSHKPAVLERISRR